MNEPYVLIYAYHAADAALIEIGAGLEEESVPFEIRAFHISASDVNPLEAAFEAAQSVRTGVGIAVTPDGAVMQMRGVPVDKPVFTVTGEDRRSLRRLGQNAARAVKGGAFLI